MLPDSLAVLASKGKEKSEHSPRPCLLHDSKRVCIGGVGLMSKIAWLQVLQPRGEIDHELETMIIQSQPRARTSNRLIDQASNEAKSQLE